MVLWLAKAGCNIDVSNSILNGIDEERWRKTLF